MDQMHRRWADAGEQVWPVGGCVRDLLDGRTPADIDLACSTSPERTAELAAEFGTVTLVGAQFGTVVVHTPGGLDYELTTLRGETYAPGSRHPEVTFDAGIADDLARRDFTIGAMALDRHGNLIDPFGGVDDLEAGVVRAVGDPATRFSEDPLRILRAARFCSVADRTLDPGTRSAAIETASLLEDVSTERIRSELDKVISADLPDALSRFAETTADLGAGDRVFGVDLDPAVDLSAVQSRPARLGALAAAGVDLRGQKFSNLDTNLARQVTIAAADHDPFRVAYRHGRPIAEASAEVRSALGRPARTRLTDAEHRRASQKMPVTGADAVAAGLSGPAVGEQLTKAEAVWIRSRGTASRAELLGSLLNVPG